LITSITTCLDLLLVQEEKFEKHRCLEFDSVLANIATSLLQPISTLLIVDEATLKMDMITTQTTQYDEEVILLI